MVNKDKPISYTTFRDHLSKSLRSVVPDPSVMALIHLGQGELPRLPTAAWASEFFRGTGGGRVFRPRTAMSKDFSFEHPFFKPFLCLLLDYLLYSSARPKHAK